jgi:hypothetical protein
MLWRVKEPRGIDTANFNSRPGRAAVYCRELIVAEAADVMTEGGSHTDRCGVVAVYGAPAEAWLKIASMVLIDLWPNLPRVTTDDEYLATIEPTER